jgi:hypothetical protein
MYMAEAARTDFVECVMKVEFQMLCLVGFVDQAELWLMDLVYHISLCGMNIGV